MIHTWAILSHVSLRCKLPSGKKQWKSMELVYTVAKSCAERYHTSLRWVQDISVVNRSFCLGVNIAYSTALLQDYSLLPSCRSAMFGRKLDIYNITTMLVTYCWLEKVPIIKIFFFLDVYTTLFTLLGLMSPSLQENSWGIKNTSDITSRHISVF